MTKETVQIVMSYRYVLVCTFSLICGLAVPAHSQKFMAGFKVGGQITNKFTYPPLSGLVLRAAPEDDRVLFGPWGEFRVTHALSLEMDALYERKWFNASITWSLPHPGTGVE